MGFNKVPDEDQNFSHYIRFVFLTVIVVNGLNCALFLNANDESWFLLYIYSLIGWL